MNLLLELTERYCESHRHYHGIGHIADMLARGAGLGLSDAQRLAIWFHDAVYDPTRDDNEERSAVLAEERLRDDGIDAATCALVARIVRDTATHTPSRPESELVLDLDLHSLALDWPAFANNTEAIRREYAHVPDEAFAEGRRAFFERMLTRDQLFFTPWGTTLEAKARSNLQRAIADS